MEYLSGQCKRYSRRSFPATNFATRFVTAKYVGCAKGTAGRDHKQYWPAF